MHSTDISTININGFDMNYITYSETVKAGFASTGEFDSYIITHNVYGYDSDDYYITFDVYVFNLESQPDQNNINSCEAMNSFYTFDM